MVTGCSENGMVEVFDVLRREMAHPDPNMQGNFTLIPVITPEQFLDRIRNGAPACISPDREQSSGDE